MKNNITKLTGKVQNYAWGGYDFIPQLFNIEKQDNKPYAEYWMGAHPSASSIIETNREATPLNVLIEKDPTVYLGQTVYERFGQLPYLFKVLDVREMLSIQVHPTKKEAAKCFEAEEAAGVPLNAPNRNYKDKNHKPEVMVALSEFWLLHGFKQKPELKKALKAVPELNVLLPVFERDDYEGLYREAMEMPQEKVNAMLRPLVYRESIRKEVLQKEEPGYWVNKFYQDGVAIKDIDRGIFSIYFFNIVNVQPKEGVFQGAGIPHAYLEGQNIELMANSDNVLRGGLTSKYIDVVELLKHTRFEGVTPQVLKAEEIKTHEKYYACPEDDFGLSIIEMKTSEAYQSKSYSGEIFLVTEGTVATDSGEEFTRGKIFYVLPETKYSIEAIENTVIYKAFVPS